jgi:hypothetical protein
MLVRASFVCICFLCFDISIDFAITANPVVPDVLSLPCFSAIFARNHVDPS